jgi:hypothetical protein
MIWVHTFGMEIGCPDYVLSRVFEPYQENIGILPQISHALYLPNPFQFIIQ